MVKAENINLSTIPDQDLLIPINDYSCLPIFIALYYVTCPNDYLGEIK